MSFNGSVLFINGSILRTLQVGRWVAQLIFTVFIKFQSHTNWKLFPGNTQRTLRQNNILLDLAVHREGFIPKSTRLFAVDNKSFSKYLDALEIEIGSKPLEKIAKTILQLAIEKGLAQ